MASGSEVSTDLRIGFGLTFLELFMTSPLAASSAEASSAAASSVCVAV